MSLEEMGLKLFLALLSGALVGIERERKDRPAGLRTHMVVSAGSTLITLVSISLAGASEDRTRIAAQIVSGIGFLGAGTIFRSGNEVRGLTTAAGLWTVAGIGMAIAVGGTVLYLGLITAAAVFAINRWIGHLENQYFRNRHRLIVRTARDSDVLARLLEGMHQREVSVHQVHWISDETEPEVAVLELVLELGPNCGIDEVTGWIASMDGVLHVRRE
jgi:putative Mg2+ transporter-C (MgtC) family protein